MTVAKGRFKIKTAANYADMSERTLRGWLKKGLRHSRLPSGTVLIKKEWLDEFLERYESDQGEDLDRIVNEILREMKGG